MPEKITFQDYQSRLHQEFKIQWESENWTVAELVEARELGFKYPDADGVERAAFTLVFRAGSQVHLSQGTYPVKHDELGEFKIFLVPLQPDEAGTFYEAVFT